MIDLTVRPETVSAALGVGSPVSELAFALQTGVNWFLGSGVHRFRITRTKDSNGRCILSLNAMSEPRSYSFAPVAALSELAENGFFPLLLSEKWQHETLRKEETVVEHEDVKIKQSTIAEVGLIFSELWIWFSQGEQQRSSGKVRRTSARHGPTTDSSRSTSVSYWCQQSVSFR